MNILITGANGFIGKNLVSHLENIRGYHILKFTRESSDDELNDYVQKADFIIHLAGAIRPKDSQEFTTINVNLTQKIVDLLIKNHKSTPVIFSSSIQVKNSNPYGISKLAAENILTSYAEQLKTSLYIYRLPNIFGKWSNPNYNSVVATWCYNISRGIEIEITDPDKEINFIYIDHLIDDFMKQIQSSRPEFFQVIFPILPTGNSISLQKLADTIKSFDDNQDISFSNDRFTRYLYSTYLSFLPEEKVKTEVINHSDKRGSFFEIFKNNQNGQISLSTTKPGVVRGNHYHHSKVEKFVVIQGEAIIKMRKIDEDIVYSFKVSGDNPSIVNMLPGYTHNIENVGNNDMLLLMWSNEIFDPQRPDTTPLEV